MSIQISPKHYERKLNWDDGKLYCDLLSIDGKNDWRMPTLEECKIIFSIVMPMMFHMTIMVNHWMTVFGIGRKMKKTTIFRDIVGGLSDIYLMIKVIVPVKQIEKYYNMLDQLEL